ncbi:MAG: hypothetical protein QOK16_3060 [Solirubrobacteraceae bacterium]|jgi:hypothetical protein|nr:hypothetical protein [Solirubrobacteraceae bacterium]MEA2188049.1 hypothetical protein [Solirubrobacteraceae bacterium]
MNKRRITLFAVLLAGGLAVAVGQTAYADNDPQPGVPYELFAPYFNPGDDKCLDVPNGTSQIGAVLQVYHCHGGGPQRWQLIQRLDKMNNLRYEIMNEGSRACLNMQNRSGATGTLVVQDLCITQPPGLWVLEKTPAVGPYFILRNVQFPNQCLSTSNSSGNNRTRVEIADCQPPPNQFDPGWIRQIWSLG